MPLFRTKIENKSNIIFEQLLKNELHPQADFQKIFDCKKLS